MRSHRIFVLITTLLACFVIAGLTLLHAKSSSTARHWDLSSAPQLGPSDAPVQILLFEDFQCPHCCQFHLEVFPQIRDQYIDTGKVHYLIIPLAVLQGSKPVANAALFIYQETPEQFFPFLHQLALRCERQELLTPTLLVRLAETVGGIDLARLRHCIETRCLYPRLEENLQLAQHLMGRNIEIPTLYLNGEPVSNRSFRSLQARIDFLLRLKEGS